MQIDTFHLSITSLGWLLDILILDIFPYHNTIILNVHYVFETTQELCAFGWTRVHFIGVSHGFANYDSLTAGAYYLDHVDSSSADSMSLILILCTLLITVILC